MTREKNGFTLIELLITIAIIGILAAIAVPTYMGQMRKAAMSESQSNLQNLRLLEEQFFAENGRYAPPDPSVTPLPALSTARFQVGDESIRTSLPGFRPGNASDLSYDYVIYRPAQLLTAGTCASNGDDPAAPAQSSFTACAMPRAGTRVDGSVALFINDRNQNNF